MSGIDERPVDLEARMFTWVEALVGEVGVLERNHDKLISALTELADAHRKIAGDTAVIIMAERVIDDCRADREELGVSRKTRQSRMING